MKKVLIAVVFLFILGSCAGWRKQFKEELGGTTDTLNHVEILGGTDSEEKQNQPASFNSRAIKQKVIPVKVLEPGGVNVRNDKRKVIARLTKGPTYYWNGQTTEMAIDGKRHTMWWLRYNGGSGWVAAEHLRRSR